MLGLLVLLIPAAPNEAPKPAAPKDEPEAEPAVEGAVEGNGDAPVEGAAGVPGIAGAEGAEGDEGDAKVCQGFTLAASAVPVVGAEGMLGMLKGLAAPGAVGDAGAVGAVKAPATEGAAPEIASTPASGAFGRGFIPSPLGCPSTGSFGSSNASSSARPGSMRSPCVSDVCLRKRLKKDISESSCGFVGAFLAVSVLSDVGGGTPEGVPMFGSRASSFGARRGGPISAPNAFAREHFESRRDGHKGAEHDDSNSAIFRASADL